MLVALRRTPGVEIHLGLFPRHRQPVGESADPSKEAGYAPLAHFALPEHCWTENYFAHASARIPGFLEQYGYSEKALLLAEMQKNEIAHYEKYKAYYGYVFYIGQKPEE